MEVLLKILDVLLYGFGIFFVLYILAVRGDALKNFLFDLFDDYPIKFNWISGTLFFIFLTGIFIIQGEFFIISFASWLILLFVVPFLFLYLKSPKLFKLLASTTLAITMSYGLILFFSIDNSRDAIGFSFVPGYSVYYKTESVIVDYADWGYSEENKDIAYIKTGNKYLNYLLVNIFPTIHRLIVFLLYILSLYLIIHIKTKRSAMMLRGSNTHGLAPQVRPSVVIPPEVFTNLRSEQPQQPKTFTIGKKEFRIEQRDGVTFIPFDGKDETKTIEGYVDTDQYEVVPIKETVRIEGVHEFAKIKTQEIIQGVEIRRLCVSNEISTVNTKGNPLSSDPSNTALAKAVLLAKAGLAKLRYPNNDYYGAIDDFTKAIAIDSKESLYYRYRSWAKKKLGDLVDVLSDQDKEIEFAPHNSPSYISRASTKSQLNDLSGAISDYNKALEIEPLNSYYYNYRADIKRKQGDFAGAIIDYTKIIELNEIARTGYYMRGIVKHQIGDTTFCDDWKVAAEFGNVHAAKLLETYCPDIS